MPEAHESESWKTFCAVGGTKTVVWPVDAPPVENPEATAVPERHDQLTYTYCVVLAVTLLGEHESVGVPSGVTAGLGRGDGVGSPLPIMPPAPAPFGYPCGGMMLGCGAG